MERGGSAVERWTRNRDSRGSNPHCFRLNTRAFSFSPRCLSSLSCINEYMAIDSDGNVSVSSLCIIAAWLNASQRSRVGAGMNRSAKGGKA